MAAYCEYAFYTGTFKGTAIAQADFDRLALRASEFIDQVTFDRAADETNADNLVKIEMATCAVAEKIQELEASGGAVQSETLGRSSVTYVSKLSDNARLTNIAKRYLWSTDLMYPGFTEDER